MSDHESIIPEGQALPDPQFDNTPGEDFEDAFSEMESDLGASLPEGAYVTLRSGANAPRYAPLYEGEDAVSIRILADRAGLTFGGSINIYVDNAQVAMDTPVPAGTVVTFIGK